MSQIVYPPWGIKSVMLVKPSKLIKNHQFGRVVQRYRFYTPGGVSQLSHLLSIIVLIHIKLYAK